jgi:hypothetical protein
MNMSKVKRFLKGLAKELDPRDPFIKWSGRRTIDNLWTGYEFGGQAKILGTAAILGYGSYRIYQAPLDALEQEAIAQDIQSLPGTRGDMTGYMAYGGSVGGGLETSGDLVFALHKLRHGG